MKRHRITYCKVGCGRRKGLGLLTLLTKNGSLTIAFGKGVHGEHVIYRLKKHLPHLFHILMGRGSWTEDELRKLLVGRYLYGKAVERTHEEMVYKTFE